VVELWEFDEAIRREGFSVIAGVDEAGRGCLAGPVVAAAVILPSDFVEARVRDSKQLSPRAREFLFELITASAISWGIGVVESQLIDTINIRRASLRAMLKAMAALEEGPELVLVDGIYKMPQPLPQKTIKGGDRRSLSVASASILAKVARDRMMCQLDCKYPEYHFASNKGYPTKEHIEALMRYGPSPVHRRSFGPVRDALCRPINGMR